MPEAFKNPKAVRGSAPSKPGLTGERSPRAVHFSGEDAEKQWAFSGKVIFCN